MNVIQDIVVQNINNISIIKYNNVSIHIVFKVINNITVIFHANHKELRLNIIITIQMAHTQ